MAVSARRLDKLKFVGHYLIPTSFIPRINLNGNPRAIILPTPRGALANIDSINLITAGGILI
jgi:hypothetical protein